MNPWALTGRALFWLAWPVLWVYMRVGYRTRVLVRAEDRVLLVQTWMGNGRWGLPGGGLHSRELPVVGAVRETREETGVPLLPEQCKQLSSEICSNSGLTFSCHFFIAWLPMAMEPHKQRIEILEAHWFSVNELQHIACKPEVRRALELSAAR